MNLSFLARIVIILAATVVVAAIGIWNRASSCNSGSGVPDSAAAHFGESTSIEKRFSDPSQILKSESTAQVESIVSHQQEQGEAPDSLSDTEQASLWTALAGARRAVMPLTSQESALPQNEGVRFFAQNPGQQITARFLDGGVRIESGRNEDWSATLSLAGNKSTIPRLENGSVEYHHQNGVVEKYENREEGIEQSFTVARPLNRGRLRIDLELDGLLARSSSKELDDTVEFHLPENGATVLHYGEVKAWDFEGRLLEAHYEVHSGGIGIIVADAKAIYPVTIDPLITSEESKIGPVFDGDGDRSDRFGASVSLHGDTALIGAPWDDTTAGDLAGSAYVFVRSGVDWILEGKLTPSAGLPGDRFGWSVCLENDTALIGAPQRGPAGGNNAGSAYVFVRSDGRWTEQATLRGEVSAGRDNFGISVSLAGETALVGAPPDIPTGIGGVGSAYVFVRSGDAWTQEAKLQAADGEEGDYYGVSVSLDNDTALVGASLDDSSGGSLAGSVHVYIRSGGIWTQQAHLTPPAGSTGHFFGGSISLDGDTAVIGAIMNFGQAGCAYVFVRSGVVWSQQSRLTANDGKANDGFGGAVSLDGDTVVIGAERTDTIAGSDAGSAYVFVRSGNVWTQQTKLTANNGVAGDRFGSAVSLVGDTAIVAAPVAATSGAGEAGGAYIFSRSGTAWNQQSSLDSGDGGAYDRFGAAVSLDGDTALIGTPQDNTAGGIYAGSAYAFVRTGSNWQLQAKLQAEDGSPNARFGGSVSLDSDTAIVGAFQDNTAGGEAAGSAYAFVRSNGFWTQQAKLEGDDSSASDSFGCSVSMKGNTAIVGARGYDSTGEFNTGGAYVFVRTGVSWAQQARLTASDGNSDDLFGHSIALDGDTALVGAFSAYVEEKGGVGCVYVFTRSGNSWIEQSKLTAADGAAYDYFGYSLSLEGDTALIGAVYGDTAGGVNAGSAYVFVSSNGIWTQQAKLVASEGSESDNFGSSVSLNGNTSIVGAPQDGPSGAGKAGNAYIFVRSGTSWHQRARISASDGAADDRFGISVALDGDTALVGADADDTLHPFTGDPRTNHGSVYVIRILRPEIEIFNGTSTAAVNQRSDNAEAVDFGSAHTKSNAWSRVYTVKNGGKADLIVGELVIRGMASTQFAVSQPSSTTLAAGESTTFEVAFDPTSGGVKTAAVEIPSDDPTSPTFRIPLEGMGIAEPLVDEGSLIYSRSDSQVNLAKSTGATPQGGTFTGPGVTGIFFNPSALSAGTYILTYTTPQDSYGSDFSVSFKVIVTDQSRLSLGSPKRFSPIGINNRSVPQTIHVTNIGKLTAIGLRVTVEGAGKRDFNVVGPLRRSLAPGNSAPLKITFQPKRPGNRKAMLRVHSLNASSAKAPLNGVGRGPRGPIATNP